MALLDIKCAPNSLSEYFGRKTENYLDITTFMNDSKIKANRKLMKKYMIEKFANEIIFDNLRFSTTYRILIAKTIIFDTQTRNLYFSLNDQTIQVLHQNPESLKFDKETTKIIEKSQRINGIGLVERKELDQLQMFFEIREFQRKWITDFEYVFRANKVQLHMKIEGSSHIRLIHTQDRELTLYGCSLTELLKFNKYRIISVWSKLNIQILSKIPSTIKKGDKISRIVECRDVMLIEKETGVIWEIKN